MPKKSCMIGMGKWLIYSKTRIKTEYIDEISAKKLGQIFKKSTLNFFEFFQVHANSNLNISKTN